MKLLLAGAVASVAALVAVPAAADPKDDKNKDQVCELVPKVGNGKGPTYVEVCHKRVVPTPKPRPAHAHAHPRAVRQGHS